LPLLSDSSLTAGLGSGSGSGSGSSSECSSETDYDFEERFLNSPTRNPRLLESWDLWPLTSPPSKCQKKTRQTRPAFIFSNRFSNRNIQALRMEKWKKWKSEPALGNRKGGQLCCFRYHLIVFDDAQCLFIDKIYHTTFN
jgi:hypothetical protein